MAASSVCEDVVCGGAVRGGVRPLEHLAGGSISRRVGLRPSWASSFRRRGGLTARVAGWWAGRMAGPAGFVGRESEMSRLLEALGGDARAVLVVGDAGVGKTRFVEEGMSRAAAAGMVVVRGECLPLTGTLPLLPVADALGDLGRMSGGGLLAAALDAAPGYVRDEIARLLPELNRTGGGIGPDGRDGEWSRER